MTSGRRVLAVVVALLLASSTAWATGEPLAGEKLELTPPRLRLAQYGAPVPYYPAPVARRRGPGPMALIGVVVGATGAMMSIIGLGLYGASAVRAATGPYEPTLGAYIDKAETDMRRQRAGLGLLGAGGILFLSGILVAVLGRSLERTVAGRDTKLVVGPGSVGLNGRF